MPLFGKRKKEDKSTEAGGDKKQAVANDKSTSGKSMKDLYQEPGQPKKQVNQVKQDTKEKKAKIRQESKTSSKEVTGSRKINQHGRAYKTLIKPIITEKSGDLGVQNKYIFEIATSSNRVEVAQAIEEVYGVKPAKVNILNIKGKKVRFGRVNGKRKDWKKAVVTLPKGKTINVYEGV